MVGHPAKSRPTSTRASASASRKTPRVAAKKSVAAARRTPTNAARECNAPYMELVQDEVESIHSSGGDSNVDVVVDGTDGDVTAATQVSTAPKVTPIVDVNTPVPQPAEACPQHPKSLRPASANQPSHQPSRSASLPLWLSGAAGSVVVTCVSSDDESHRVDADALPQLEQQRPSATPHGMAFAMAHASSPASASILGVSRLSDVFTYGVQAAMAHYADHFSNDDDETAEGEGGTTVARFRNSFLADPARRGHDKESTGANAVSRSSSATTYDSDAETLTAVPPQGHAQGAVVQEHLLEPHLTSLYRAPPSSTVSQSIAGDSWSGTHPRGVGPPPTAPPVSAALPSREGDWASGGAHACFREALCRAYACEDAVRRWRRDAVNRPRAQLIRMLTTLKRDGSRSEATVSKPACCGPDEGVGQALHPARGRLLSAHQNAKPSLHQPSNSTPPSLSHLAEHAETTTQAPSPGQHPPMSQSTSPPHTKRTSKKGREQCVTADILFAVDGEDTASNGTDASRGVGAGVICDTSSSPESKMITTPPRHIMQVVDPSRLYKLRRTPNVLVDTLLKHHREAQLKQQAVQHAEDQATHARRLYELPVLTEDIVRYAALLVGLKRPGKRSLNAAADAAHSVGNGDARPSSDSTGGNHETPPSPMGSVTTQVSPTLPASQFASDTTVHLPSYGEDGSLLYLKYPAPLLRTTSFAVETVRLLKWLRTWRNSGPAFAGSLSPCAPQPPPLPPARPTVKQQRKRVKPESPAETYSRTALNAGGASDRSAIPTGALAFAPPSTPDGHHATKRSTVEEVHRRVQRAQQMSEDQSRQEKRSAFLKFFGAAVASSSIKQKEEAVVVVDTEERGSGGATGRTIVGVPRVASPSKVTIEATTTTGVASLSVPPAFPQSPARMNDEEEEQAVVQQPQSRASAASSPPSVTIASDAVLGAAPPQQQLLPVRPAMYAYQLYCHAWRHAVKTGITPLATAAQAFTGSRCATTTAGATSAAGCGHEDGPNGSGVSRVCAALPFFKEMQEEAQRTALGSAARDVYYEDAYGNRLRSARLAQKEREKQAQLAAQQRRRAKRKGYFHRDDADGERAAGRSAAAMLEAMLFPITTAPSTEGTSRSSGKSRSNEECRARRKRRRGRSVSSSSSNSSGSEDESPPVYISDGDDDGNVAETATTRTTAKAAKAAPRNGKGNVRGKRADVRASDASSRTSSDSDGDEAADTDEVTNIAVVSGPTGAGKTAAVYVAAQLLGFRVVEMNAAVRRCPKTVEHLLAELTRSYRLSGLRSTSSGFNVEEELTKLKQQHAAMMEKAKAQAAEAEREAEQKRREARKANGISAQAVASFFAKGSGGKTGADGNQPAKQQRPATAMNVYEVTEDDGVGQKSLLPSVSSPASPGPTQTPAAPAVGVRTLLLFEDADILLGDESARPFYAAIRDLAHRSKVPIVVTVSADASPAQRYDTTTLSFPAPGLAWRGGANTASVPPLQPTYWRLCEEAGLNTAMDCLEASYCALHASPVLGDRGSGAVVNDIVPGSAGAGSGPDGASGYSGGNSPVQSTHNTASAITSFCSAPGTSASASAGLTGIGVNASGTAGTGSPSPSGLGGGGTNSGINGSVAASASSPTARYTHMLLNASLVANFFGSQTPFTVVDALPPTALFAQLLAVGAVELNLFQWQSSLSHDAAFTNAAAGSQLPLTPSPLPSWQHGMDRLTGSLTLRDPELFFELAGHLCQALFGTSAEGQATGSAGLHARESKSHDSPVLVANVHYDAASRSTTDVRYWLNRLQMLLLTLPQRPGATPAPDTVKPDKNSDATGIGVAPQWSKAGMCDDRLAERLLEREFQQHTSFAASAWDRALGQYMTLLNHNELHSSRYEYWLLDDHVDYVADIVGELNMQDHPTRNIDYRTPAHGVKTAPPSQPGAGPRRGGRPPLLQKATDATKGGRSGSRVSSAATASVGSATAFPSSTVVVDVHPSSSASGGGSSSSGSGSRSPGGGLNPAWRALFGGAKGTAAATLPPTATHVPPSASARAGGQQTLFDFLGGPTSTAGSSSPAAAAPTAGAVFDLPSRYEWPPSLPELRKQAGSSSRLRPVDLLLPYSTAQAYYDAVATSASPSTQWRVPDVPDPSPALLGHDTPLRFVNRHGGREIVEEDGDYCDVGRELPSSVHATQDERCAVFRRWWRRTRKAGAVRDSVAGRSPGALEDMLGYGCLLTTLRTPATSTGSGGT